ncbi:hypothetical protein Poli38472_010642 [Pythium oligandrum]|uniref:Uncharacterized protein n=1 Tax=Pythium oligandrum TaxID=41045 RepID=A0A8K1C3I8_PYTOL|nr:hypothetical protein Poli38472_010642 [Pythium oligandrum]|eukprot:TMW55760.1 hypothetical protein Poli38472_010642 [Pythium oligandrum]
MGMACEAEGRAATKIHGGAAVDGQVDASDVAVTGKCENKDEGRRSRSNSEETALILTSMSQGRVAFPGGGNDSDGMDDSRHSDLDDFSGDEQDGKQRGSMLYGEGNGQHGFVDGQRLRNESNRVKSMVTKHISIDELRAHFDRPIIDVAKEFGICITLMKKICRRNGIKRWPHRQIRSLSKSIASMEAAMLSTQGSEREKYRDQIMSLKLKRDAVIADPNKENTMMRPKTPTKEPSTRPHHVTTGPKLSPRATSSSHHASTTKMSTSDSNGAPHSKGGRWTSEEHAAFLEGIKMYGKDWRRVAKVVSTRSAVQTRTHAQKYLLKFAGRFPFEAEGALKGEAENERVAERDEVDGASMSSFDDEGPVSTLRDQVVYLPKTMVKDPMAMILNSPHLESMRSMSMDSQSSLSLSTGNNTPGFVPPVVHQGDVVMESPRGVLLPPFSSQPQPADSRQETETSYGSTTFAH